MSNVLRFPSGAPGVTSSQPGDFDARLRALDIQTSCIVEAPAGSGKTGLLMQRYLKLLADPATTQPEEVLAITFTNKATAELRERIVAQLEAAHTSTVLTENASDFDRETRTFAEAVLIRDRQQSWGILHQPYRLNIRTIDSICAEIANSLPLLSGSGGSQRPAPDATPLYRLAAQRTLMQLGGADRDLHDALHTVLLHRDGSLSDVERLLANMLAEREQWAAFVPLTASETHFLDTDVRLRLERALESIVCAALARATGLMPPGMLHRLTALAAELGPNPGYNGAENPIAFCSFRNEPPQAAADHLDHWQALISLLLTNNGDWRKSFNVNVIKFAMDKQEKAQLQDLIETHKSDALCAALCDVRDLPPSRYPDDQWAVAKALFHILRRALAELKVLFAERSTCDFTELAIAAREALASTDESAVDLALTPGGRLRHLLVDEMQDTSAGQYELIHLLTRSWDGVSQTLFLVGDPKQSIYLFRQARVERFLRTMREQKLGDIRLVPLRLTANFRSQAALVHDFNTTFEKLFPSLEEVARTHNTLDVPFVDATPTRAETGTCSIAWHATVLDPSTNSVLAGSHGLPGSNPGPATSAHEPQTIRAIIEHWLREPLPANRTKPWQIAILARARHHLAPIVAELKRDYGNGAIPYSAVDIDPLATRPEVLDAFALTRALLHPADRVAWLAVLRAPWCGLSRADLLALTGEGPAADRCATIASLVATRSQNLSDEGRHLLARAWPTLSTAVNTLGSTSIATHVERTWRSLGGDAPLTTVERANVLRFFDVLREAAAEATFVDLTALQSRIDKLYAEPASGNVQVELLTIHKAKGLEWDVVLVPGLERRSASATSDLLNWLELDNTGDETASVILAPIAGKGVESGKLNNWLRRAKEARENAERKRLFYVLATRAKEELHLFATATRKKDSIELNQPIHGSLLKSIWPAAVEPFDQVNVGAGQLQQSLRDSLNTEDHTHAPESWATSFPLALAAAAASAVPPPTIHRLPANFNPLARFTAAKKLLYTPAASLRHAPMFDRPEGSFAVRAFGNVVHRYLQLLSSTLETTPVAELLAELPTWQPRLLASLRGEGLAPNIAEREAARALAALTQALNDPIGLWLLSPQPSAFTERPLTTIASSLRVDRTFLAGVTPQSTGESHTWIVDFKTASARGLSDAAFEAEESAKYSAQLETYAAAAHALTSTPKPVMLALYYPLIPRLLYWPSSLPLNP